jgi:acyl transferase domain-containing protein
MEFPRPGKGSAIPSSGNSCARPAVVRTWRCAAADERTLAARLTVAASLGNSLWNASETAFSPSDVWRVAIVATSPAELAQKAQIASTKVGQPNAATVLQRQGILLVRVPSEAPQVAFAFPGQGTHYRGMLEPLLQSSPAAAAALADCDRVMKEMGLEDFSTLTAHDPQCLATDLWRNQLAVLLSGHILADALQRLGIRPDVVIGHSYGEFTALVSAGAWTLAEAVRISRARADAILASPSAKGSMWAANVTLDELQPLLDASGGLVHLANFNSPRQLVFAGQTEAAAKVAAQLAARGTPSMLLPVPAPFHTPLLKDAARRFSPTVSRAALGPGRLPLLSSLRSRFIADPQEIRQSLVEQLTTMVPYAEMFDQLVQRGNMIVIEVGARQVLTRLHQKMLASRATCWAIATDATGEAGIEQLACVEALLECCGVQRPRPVQTGLSAAPLVVFDATERRRQKQRARAARVEPPGGSIKPLEYSALNWGSAPA